MKFNYQLNNSDFLAFQLYNSSKSEALKKRRFRSRIIIPLIYLAFGLYLATSNGDVGIGVILSLVALVWFALYPKYSKWRYKRHFQKHIEVNNKSLVDQPIEVEFDGSSMKTKDSTSKSKTKGSELKNLTETQHHFFVTLGSGQSMVVPKYRMENAEEFKKQVLDLGANYSDELDWEWK